MTVKTRRRLIPDFEACSVALFASLALSGSLASRVPTAAPIASSHRSAAPPTAPYPLNRWTAELRKPVK